MENRILTFHRQSDVCWLCEQHFKSKEKMSAITLVDFKTLKKHAKRWTTVEKVTSSFGKSKEI